jgi:branched-chain amino acid transport system permease protein
LIEQYWVEILTIAGINSIIAIGLYIVMSTGQLSVAQAAFSGIGGYTVGVLTVNFGLPFWIGVVVAVLMSTLIGAALAALLLRLRHFYMAIATMGFGEMLVVVITNNQYLGGSTGFRGIARTTDFLAVGLVLAVVLFFAWRLQDSRIGQAFRAVRDDEIVASAIGIDPKAMRMLAFAIGSGIGGLGGSLQAQYLGLVQAPDLSFVHSVSFLVFVAFGGTEIFWGALLGSLALTLLPEVLRFSLYDRYSVYGVLLVLTMIFRSKGLIGRRPLGVTSSWKPWRRGPRTD